MANYYGYTRTNYFSVTDPEKLKDIVDRIRWSEGDSPFFSEENGKYCFGAYDTIMGLSMKKDEAQDANAAYNLYDEDEDYDDDKERNADMVYDALQEIVAPDDAIIITEVGHEKLRYLKGHALVITKDEIAYINLHDAAIDKARALLSNDQYTTQNEY